MYAVSNSSQPYTRANYLESHARTQALAKSDFSGLYHNPKP